MASSHGIYRAGGSNFTLVRQNLMSFYNPSNTTPKGYALLCEAQPACVSMLLLGGSGGMPPRKIFKITLSEIEFEGIFLEFKLYLNYAGSSS